MCSYVHLLNISVLSTIALYSLSRLEEQDVSLIRDINFQLQSQAVGGPFCRRDDDD